MSGIDLDIGWNYKSEEKVSTGYEGEYENLSKYSADDYKKASKEEKQRMIQEVADIYERVGIFPIKYFNEEGVIEEIQKAIEYEPKIVDGIVDTGAGVATALCNFFMPNLYEAYNINSFKSDSEGDSAYQKFYRDRGMLESAVRFALQCDNGVMPKNIMSGIRQSGGAMPSNFRPMNARALYEAYCPEGGVIHDSSCGFGGRLTGALTSKMNFSYVGTEPNSETYKNLYRLGNAINSVTGRSNNFKIIKLGSEVFKSNEEIFDFSFTSPPYYNLEIYCDEPTQCYNKFTNVYDWLDGFVTPTVENTYHMLKHDRYYAVNIADFKTDGRLINYVNIWQGIAEKCGFEFVKDLFLRINVRASSNMKNADKGKKERIMLFYKR